MESFFKTEYDKCMSKKCFILSDKDWDLSVNEAIWKIFSRVLSCVIFETVIQKYIYSGE